jgi:hypothetical protein
MDIHIKYSLEISVIIGYLPIFLNYCNSLINFRTGLQETQDKYVPRFATTTHKIKNMYGYNTGLVSNEI